MGYILPVTQYQYTQYANRDIKTNKSPFILEPISKSSLEKKLLYSRNYKEVKVSKRVRKETKWQEIEMMESINNTTNQSLAELTGKGRLLNKSI